MELEHYLNIFQKAANRIDKKVLRVKDIEVAVGVVLDSTFLKLYKSSWANPGADPLTAETRIFFSIWVNEATLQAQKVCYNIHAFKLRKLKGYTIESRKFANAFRADFLRNERVWKNVSVDFGPLTLMEGWIVLNNEKVQEDILALATNFLEIDHLIDQTLAAFKK